MSWTVSTQKPKWSARRTRGEYDKASITLQCTSTVAATPLEAINNCGYDIGDNDAEAKELISSVINSPETQHRISTTAFNARVLLSKQLDSLSVADHAVIQQS